MILYMVIPCYNEEEVLRETAKRLKEKYSELITNGKIDTKSKIVFVNDGSKDKTWDIIDELSNLDKVYSGINLAHNVGHQNAVLAGSLVVRDKCDAVITMDADLQDDINTIDAMIEQYSLGNEIVYGVRNKRDTDTFFKRVTAEGFYKFMGLMGVDIILNHADFRLMGQRSLNALAEYGEVNLFLRGIVPTIGFKSTKVYYERAERFAGESKYPLKKMLALAINGITSFSLKPIRFIFVIALISIIAGIILSILVDLVAGLLFIATGLNMVCLGIVGEYIGKIYLEVKHRPRYIVEKTLNLDQ